MHCRYHNKGGRHLLIATAIMALLPACGESGDPSAASGTAAQIEDPLAATAPSGVPLAMNGIWQRGAGALTPHLLTDYGLAESSKTGVFDDPNVECRGYSIPRSTLSGFGVTRISVGDDHIVISYEANAGTRKIFLDGVTPSEISGVNGVSTASFAGGAVSIISRDFGPEGENALLAAGIKGAGTVYPMSADFTLYERYRMINANTLDFVMVMQDPKILAIPRVIHAQWKKLPDTTLFLQEECVLPEDEFYKVDE
jgi:hypothetical protein